MAHPRPPAKAADGEAGSAPSSAHDAGSSSAPSNASNADAASAPSSAHDANSSFKSSPRAQPRERRERARYAAVTIDVDSLRFYREIHGLAPSPGAEDPIYSVALPRFFELLSEARIPATLFLIAEDATAHAALIRDGAIATRSEIASHSFAHDYRLTTRSPAEIKDDLARAHQALLALSPNGTVRGFRAPGYNTTPALLEAVHAQAYAYDSSRLPSPLYFAARAAAIAAYALLERPSRSLVGDPRAFAGPLHPHALPLASGATLLELPIACEPLTRTPLIGTSWAVTPQPLRRAMLSSALARLPVINFEMHAIDLLDANDTNIPPELARAQRDLGVPLQRKLAAFRELFTRLANEVEVSTLEAVARAYAA